MEARIGYFAERVGLWRGGDAGAQELTLLIPPIIYAFMQAVGMVADHLNACFAKIPSHIK